MLVCIWPTDNGICLTTSNELESSRGDLVAMQEHLRDEHLGPDYQTDANYDRFRGILQGTREDVASDCYVFKLADGKRWLFSGTEEDFADWYADDSYQATRDAAAAAP